MRELKLSENIIRLRHEKKITQEALADFLGVTKGSVSKWETAQSLPDILLLPRLAAFFDISVDELLGYEPQLDKEEIKGLYHRLAGDFAQKPFEEVMAESEALVRKYYSCYPFLVQMCILWLNHFMLAEKPERQQEILDSVIGLCEHILEGSKELGICNDAMGIKEMVKLQSGKAQEVIESLEEVLDPKHMEDRERILVQAYLMTGEMEKADRVIQIVMFQNVMKLIENGIQMMLVHSQDLERCEKIMARMDSVIAAFALKELHPNSTANYCYQAAVVYCKHHRENEAFEKLEDCVEQIIRLLEEGVVLHGDDFFNQLDGWFEEFELGAQGVRNERLVRQSAIDMLENPVFAGIEQERMQKLKERLQAKAGGKRKPPL